MARKTVACALLVFLVAPFAARAAEPLPYLAVARTVSLRTPATYLVRFSLWNSPSGQAQVFSEQKEIPLRTPTLTHRLGSVDPVGNPLPLSAFAEQLYLQIEYRGAGGKWLRLGGREMLAPAPYALSTLLPAQAGPAGPAGTDGRPGEQGPPGSDGRPGVSCWDVDANAQCDLPAEDENGDGTCTAADCRGSQGEPGGLSLTCANEETLIWRNGGWSCLPVAPEGCAPGDLKACYEGGAATLNVGRCRAGMSVCGEDRAWSPCAQQVLPAEGETCEPGLSVFGARVAALFDDDCDGEWNEENAAGCVTVYPDADGDGVGGSEAGGCFCGSTLALPATITGDCDDNDPEVGTATTQYFRDADADGYRDCAEPPKALCAPEPPFTASVHTLCDCDDTVPASLEISTSRGYSVVNKGKDADHDGFGDCTVPLGWFCPGGDYTAAGYLSDTSDPEYTECDCDDADPGVASSGWYCQDADQDGFQAELDGNAMGGRNLCHPIQPYNMLCNYGQQPDCDDSDPDVKGEPYCKDDDGDGRRSASCMLHCVPVPPFVLTMAAADDCEDTDPARFENGVWFLDADGDGFGSTLGFQGCSSDALQTGMVRNALDCDDANSDPQKIKTRWCRDSDGDGFRGSCPPGSSCTSPSPSYPLPDWAPVDCNDDDAAVTTCP